MCGNYFRMTKLKKQTAKSSKPPDGLYRFRASVEEFVSQHGDHDARQFGNKTTKISRKEKRKEERKMKKMRKKAFSQHKPVRSFHFHLFTKVCNCCDMHG